jgi:peptidoglycan/LPS O-acetylase OafA/YrhL
MIHNLQSLRAIAALSVVYLHVVSDAGLNLTIGAGSFGVDLFFVISGFTMSYVGKLPVREFVIRRCIRIVPFYWLATLGTYWIASLNPSLVQSASADVRHLVYSLAFLPYPNAIGKLQPLLALGWTLNYEMYFYALFAIALTLNERFAPLLSCLVLGTAWAAITLSGTHNKTALFYADPIVFEFAFGVLVHYLTSKPWPAGTSVAQTGLRVILWIAAAACIVALPLLENFSRGSRVITAGLPAAVLVLASVLLELKYGVVESRPWTDLLGNSSYILYLVHPYVIYGIIRLCLHPSEMGPAALTAAILMLPLVASAAAIGLHMWFEMPVIRLLRRRFAEPRPLLVAAVT